LAARTDGEKTYADHQNAGENASHVWAKYDVGPMFAKYLGNKTPRKDV
jgi:hypothetical protein